jgi:hypothetical protein
MGDTWREVSNFARSFRPICDYFRDFLRRQAQSGRMVLAGAKLAESGGNPLGDDDELPTAISRGVEVVYQLKRHFLDHLADGTPEKHGPVKIATKAVEVATIGIPLLAEDAPAQGVEVVEWIAFFLPPCQRLRSDDKAKGVG